MARDATQRFYAEIWPHAAMLLRTARMLYDQPDDLVQETLFKAFWAIDKLTPNADARPWLLTILRRARIDQYRRNSRAAADISLDQLADDLPARAENRDTVIWDDPQRILDSFSDQQVIDALKKLPEEIRWTLLLVDVEGIDHADAAAIFGIPTGTVKSRAHRGRAMLREILASAQKIQTD